MIRAFALAAVAVVAALAAQALAQNCAPPLPATTWPLNTTHWPVEGYGGEHVLGTFEYVFADGSRYIHRGLDIFTYPDSTLPTVTAEGRCVIGTDRVEIIQGDTSYLYVHLDMEESDAWFDYQCAEGRVDEDTSIAPVVPYASCPSPDFSHLHYEIADGPVGNQTLIQPLTTFAELADTDAPILERTRFFANDDLTCEDGGTWAQEMPTNGFGIPLLSDRVDVVAEVSDRYRTVMAEETGDMLFPRLVRYKISDGLDPLSLAWQPAHDFACMPSVWARTTDSSDCNYYSIQDPVRSVFGPCDDDRFFVILSNVVRQDVIDPAHSLDTNVMADGFYSVTVEATDFAGNTSSLTQPVIVANASLPAKLILRDCLSDRGAEPSICGWADSPDILIRPADATFQVCMWNQGAGPIPTGTPITVRARYQTVSPVLRSRSAVETFLQGNEIVLPTETLASPVAVGSSYCMTGDLPTGGTISPFILNLAVSVSMPGDEAHAEANVLLDNNKSSVPPENAQVLDIMPFFLEQAPPGFHRRIEISMEPLSLRAADVEAEVLLGPGLEVGQIRGGFAVDAYRELPVRGAKVNRLGCKPSTDHRAVAAGSCWNSVDGFAAGGRLALDFVQAAHAVPVVVRLREGLGSGLVRLTVVEQRVDDRGLREEFGRFQTTMRRP